MASKSSTEGKGSDGKRVENISGPIGIVQVVILVGLLAIKSVPWGDILFAVFVSLYVYLISRVAFPLPKVKPAPGGWTFPGGKYFPEYVFGAGILGLLLPLALIIISFLSGDHTTVRAAAPHLFLLSAQVLSENLSFQRSSLSLPIKAMIPVIYNARRLLTLHTWVVAEFSQDLSSSVSVSSTVWNVFWRCVVVVNVIFWHYNLWAFLLPKYLPWALRTHYTAVIKSTE